MLLRRSRRRKGARASILIDSIVGVAIAIVAAYAIDHVVVLLGVENTDSTDQITQLIGTARSDAATQKDVAIFFTSDATTGTVTIAEAIPDPAGTLADPYTGATLSINHERTFTGSLTVTVNGTSEALPLTVAVGAGGALYAPPTGATTPCTTIDMTLSYTGPILSTVTVPISVPCGL